MRFLAVGCTTVLIDWTIYRLTIYIGTTPGLAKAVGFITGTVFAFVANRQWTFAVRRHGNFSEAGRFIAVYCTTLVFNVGINSGVLALIGAEQLALIVAFVFAAGVSATLNFLGMKLFVFQPAAS